MIWNGIDADGAGFVWSIYRDTSEGSALSIEPLWPQGNGFIPAGAPTLVWDVGGPITEWNFSEHGIWYRRSGYYTIDPTRWQSDNGNENTGRQVFHYRFVSASPQPLWMPTAPWLECLWTFGDPSVCTYGAPMTADTTVSAPARIYRREPLPASPPPGMSQELYGAYAIANTPDPAAGSAGGAAGGGGATGPSAFTQGLLGYASRGATGGLTVAEIPIARMGAVIHRLIPLGNANQGTTKPHAVVHVSTTSGLLGDAEEATLWQARRANWNEALGYDCPAVLWDVDHLPTSSDAERLHGILATRRCVAFRTACVTTAEAMRPAWCARFPDPAHLTANASWRVLNRTYYRAPARLIAIAGRGYLEPRDASGFQTVGVRSVPGGDTLRDPSDQNAEEWHQWKMRYRFGSGQLMYLDHLAHVFVNDTAVSAPPTGTDTAMISLGAPRADLAYDAGAPLGYAFILEPAALLRQNPSLPEYAFGVDWGVVDLVGDPVRFVNASRYLEEERAGRGDLPTFLLEPRSARCPYGAYEGTWFAAFDARRSNYAGMSANPSSANPCRGVSVSLYPKDMDNQLRDHFDNSVLQDVADTLLGQWFEPPVGGGTFFTPSRLAISDNGGDVRVSLMTSEGAQIPTVQMQLCSPDAAPPGMGGSCMNLGSMPDRRPGRIAQGVAVCYDSASPNRHIRIRHRQRATSAPEYQAEIDVFHGLGPCPARDFWNDPTRLSVTYTVNGQAITSMEDAPRTFTR